MEKDRIGEWGGGQHRPGLAWPRPRVSGPLGPTASLPVILLPSLSLSHTLDMAHVVRVARAAEGEDAWVLHRSRAAPTAPDTASRTWCPLTDSSEGRHR